MTILITILFFLFSLGQLGRISFFRQEINMYAFEVIMVIFLIRFFFQYRLQPLRTAFSVYRKLMICLIWLYISYLLSITAFTSFQNIVALMYLLRLTAYLFFFFYFYYATHKKKHLITVTQLLIFIFIPVVIISSVIQFFLYPNLQNIFYAGWDPHLYRMVGVFLEPPISGAIYSLIFFYVLNYSNIKYKGIKVLTLIFLLVLIYLTYSRGTYVGFIGAIALAGMQYLGGFKQNFGKFKNITKSRNLLFVIIIVLILSGGIFMASISTGEGAHLTRTSTIQSRLTNLQEGIQVWQKNPIAGIGYNHIRYARIIKQPLIDITDQLSHSDAGFHSSFMIILVSSGLIGLITFILGLYELAVINQYSRYAVLFLSLASLTDNVLLHPFVLLFLFVSIGAVSRLSGK